MTGPLGGRIMVRYREVLGISALLYGGFETQEVETMCELAQEEGSMAIDVGANVGVFTIPLALATGPTGSVLAVEALPDNVARLRENLDFNGISNVRVEARAAGSREGVACLRISDDPAYGSTSAEYVFKDTGRTGQVPVSRLDELWAAVGRPEVSVLKVDVEGGEIDVLRGAVELLREHHPATLVEADSTSRVGAVAEFLTTFGYELSRIPRFRPWNHLFLALRN